MEKNKGTIKHDLFVTDLWEFDFPYHEQFKPQVLEFISSPKAQLHLSENSSNNPSLTSYGGDELEFYENVSLLSFLQTQIFKLFTSVQEVHDWPKEGEGRWSFEAWINANQKGNFNPPHIHPGSNYSGCYYVQFPQDSGLIHFLDPRPQHRISSPDPPSTSTHSERGKNCYDTPNQYDSSVFTSHVKEGKVIIFPSWLMHYVDPNPTEGLRVSVCFNIVWNI